MLVVDKYYIYSLDEIYSEPNEEIRNKILELRNRELSVLGDNYFEKNIIKQYINMSLEDISNILDYKRFDITSNSVFPNQMVVCYPQIREVKSSRSIICNISGSVIKKGSIYINYNMFMENLSDGYSYVLDKNWVSELGYREFFPKNISELDLLDHKLSNPHDYSDGYNYCDIASLKGDSIRVRRLGR